MDFAKDILNSYPLSELEQLDIFGMNWLHVMVLRDELDVCKLLVKNGFDTTIKNSAGGWTCSDGRTLNSPSDKIIYPG